MNILLRRTGALGDVLQTTPIAHRLRKEFPHAQIAVETQHQAAYLRNSDVNAAAFEVRGRVDRLIDLDRVYERDISVHCVDAYMKVAFGDNGTDSDKSIRLAFGPSYASIDRNTIIFHPNVSWANRTIPAEFWGQLAKRLQKSGFKVAEIGTFLDHDLKRFGVIDTRNILPLSEQARAISNSACLVCGDSSMFVLVGATETPCVGFCTISKPEVFMPYRHGTLGWNFHALRANVECFGCREFAGDVTYLDCKFGTNACVNAFELDYVFETVMNAITNDKRIVRH